MESISSEQTRWAICERIKARRRGRKMVSSVSCKLRFRGKQSKAYTRLQSHEACGMKTTKALKQASCVCQFFET